MTEAAPSAQMIPIAQINILNPRSRNKATFQDIVSNISNVGLKKPITVARREQTSDGKLYVRIPGQSEHDSGLKANTIPG